MRSSQALWASVLVSVAFHLTWLVHSSPWRHGYPAGTGWGPQGPSLHLRAVPPKQPTADVAPVAAVAPAATAEGLAPQGARYPRKEYIPSQYLSVPPKPLAPVEVPFPQVNADALRVRVQLSLFIDDTGQVQRIRVDNAQPHAALQDAAVTTFLATRFRAGERDGHPVGALLRVEVLFESEAPESPGAQHKSTVALDLPALVPANSENQGLHATHTP